MDVKIVHDNIKFKLRVSGIIIEDNRILVEQYKEDEYCLPGGYVELNETTANAIKRELYEETNIKFEIDRFFCVVENFFTNKRNERTHEIDFYYFLKGSNLYRNFNYNGMRTNALATILLGNNGNNFKITNYSKDYVYELINILLLSINNSDDLKKLESELFGLDDLNDFNKHPINIIRKELKKK